MTVNHKTIKSQSISVHHSNAVVQRLSSDNAYSSILIDGERILINNPHNMAPLESERLNNS